MIQRIIFLNYIGGAESPQKGQLFVWKWKVIIHFLQKVQDSLLRLCLAVCNLHEEVWRTKCPYIACTCIWAQIWWVYINSRVGAVNCTVQCILQTACSGQPQAERSPVQCCSHRWSGMAAYWKCWMLLWVIIYWPWLILWDRVNRICPVSRPFLFSVCLDLHSVVMFYVSCRPTYYFTIISFITP